MNNFKDKIKKVISLIIIFLLMRLVEIEENKLAKVLEILIMFYRIENSVNNLISNNSSNDFNEDK